MTSSVTLLSEDFIANPKVMGPYLRAGVNVYVLTAEGDRVGLWIQHTNWKRRVWATSWPRDDPPDDFD